jgi:hypothetical protein
MASATIVPVAQGLYLCDGQWVADTRVLVQ